MRNKTSTFQAGDVLHDRLRPYLSMTALVKATRACTTEMLVLRAKEHRDPKFLVTAATVEFAIAASAVVQHPLNVVVVCRCICDACIPV